MPNMGFLKDFEKDLKASGIHVGASQPPRYWFSTGNYALNRIISGNFYKGIPQGRVLGLMGPSGTGKAQPLSSKVLTPNGWKLMKDINVDDNILTPNGDISKIVAIHPQGIKDIFTIKFSDGSSTKCCKDHLWECWVKDETLKPPVRKIIDTNFIIDFLEDKKRKNKRKNISIDLINPIEQLEMELPIHPYLLGLLLGDSCITTSTPLFTSNDEFLIEKLQNTLVSGYELTQKTSNRYGYNIRQDFRSYGKGTNKGSSKNYYTTILKNIGLWSVRSYEKFIPEIYKNGSIDQRLELIRGLFDTDGYVDQTGSISYETTSQTLALDIQEIMWSLGAKCSIYNKNTHYYYNNKKKNGKLFYTLYISYKTPKELFSLPRKKDRCKGIFEKKQLRRQIVEVKLTSNEKAQCITINHPDHLYITDDYIITHNSFLSANLLAQAQAEDGHGVVIDTEHALDNEFVTPIGVDPEGKYTYLEANTIPECKRIVSKFIKAYKKEYGDDETAPKVLVVIDSLDMLMTETEEEHFAKGISKGDMGQRNRQLKAMLREFVQSIKHLNISILVTGDVYRNQDPLNGEGIWIISDGVRFALSQIVLLTKLKLKADSNVIGIKMRCEGFKTRFTQPYQKVEIEVPYDTGMDPYSGLLDAAKALDVVNQKGAWYNIKGDTEKFYAKDIEKYAQKMLKLCEAKTRTFLNVEENEIEQLETAMNIKNMRLKKYSDTNK